MIALRMKSKILNRPAGPNDLTLLASPASSLARYGHSDRPGLLIIQAPFSCSSQGLCISHSQCASSSLLPTLPNPSGCLSPIHPSGFS